MESTAGTRLCALSSTGPDALGSGQEWKISRQQEFYGSGNGLRQWQWCAQPRRPYNMLGCFLE